MTQDNNKKTPYYYTSKQTGRKTIQLCFCIDESVYNDLQNLREYFYLNKKIEPSMSFICKTLINYSLDAYRQKGIIHKKLKKEKF